LQRPCFVLVRPRRRPSRAIINVTAIIATIITITPPSRPRARERGAGGSCAGKSEAIRALHSISHGHGPNTGQTRAVPRSAPSWCGAITSGKLSARKTANGSFKAATTATPYGLGPGPSQARSHSGAPETGEGRARVGGRPIADARALSLPRCNVRELDRKSGRPPAGGLFCVAGWMCEASACRVRRDSSCRRLAWFLRMFSLEHARTLPLCQIGSSGTCEMKHRRHFESSSRWNVWAIS
jgi:hypothetical protein